MAQQAYERRLLHALEKPLVDDINSAQTELDRTIRTALRELYAARANFDGRTAICDGFTGDSFTVVADLAGDPNTINILAGSGFQDAPTDISMDIDGALEADDVERYKPLFLAATQSMPIAAAPGAGMERYDIIEVRHNRDITDPTAVSLLNTITGNYAAGLANKTITWDLYGLTGTVASPAASTTPISVKQGIPQAIGTGLAAGEPTTTVGYIKIATVRREGMLPVTNQDIIDWRPMLFSSGLLDVSFYALVQTTATSVTPQDIHIAAPAGVRVAINKFSDKRVVVYIFAGLHGKQAAVGLCPAFACAEYANVADRETLGTYAARGHAVGRAGLPTPNDFLTDAAFAPKLNVAYDQPCIQFAIARTNNQTGDWYLSGGVKISVM